MSEVQSWQMKCPKCGWANSGAELRCIKCGYPLPSRTGHLIAGRKSGDTEPPRLLVKPGGFLPRLIALIIDLVILNAICLVLFFVWQATLPQLKIDNTLGFQLSVQVYYLYLAIAIVSAIYFIGSWTILGATPAMRLFNLQILDRDGQPVGFGRALVRYIFFQNVVGLLTAPLSLIMVMLSKQKRTVFDYIAGTFVVQHLDDEPAAAALPANAAPPGRVVPIAPPEAAPAPVAAAIASAPAPPAPPAPTAAPAPPAAAPPAPAAPPPPSPEPMPSATQPPQDPYAIPFAPLAPKPAPPPAEGPSQP